MSRVKTLSFEALEEFTPRAPEAPKPERSETVGSWPSREPEPPRQSKATEQLAMRIPKEDKVLFDILAEEGNFSKPQLLRRLMRAYQEHPDRVSLGK